MLETLKEFIYNHPCDISIEEIQKALEETAHIPILRTVLKQFILGKSKKKNCIWVSGESNNGKSIVINLLEKIFYCYRFLETNSNFCVKIFREKYERQIVLIDEAAMKTLFAPRAVDMSKVFIDGGGYPMEEKYCTAEYMFKGVHIFITSNIVPKVLKPQGPKNETNDER